MPTFRARKQLRFGPIFVNLTQRGFASWGFKIGRWTKNMTRGTTTLDTPGPGSLHWGRKAKR